MAYDDKFFELYAEYLDEPLVEQNHNIIIEMFNAAQQTVSHGYLKVVDIGCGLKEYARRGIYDRYVGVDIGPARDEHYNHVQLDYTKEPIHPKLPWTPTGFVSLFSLEACLPQAERYAFYQRLFDENPALLAGLSAGFYYKSRRYDETVGETGGIVSYQTQDDIGSVTLQGVQELRVVIETPSKMFGDDVVEIWKIFLRR